MLPTEDLFVYVYVVVDDAIGGGAIAIPPRPGPAPGCSDGELLAIALVRHLLGRRSEAGFLAEVARDWGPLFPVLPHQSEFNRRIRWLWGAFEQLRAMLAAGLPEDDCQQVDTSANGARRGNIRPKKVLLAGAPGGSISRDGAPAAADAAVAGPASSPAEAAANPAPTAPAPVSSPRRVNPDRSGVSLISFCLSVTGLRCSSVSGTLFAALIWNAGYAA
jgi:hypothetical protein